MPTRNRAPKGSPCWADLWTSDVEGSRRFYSEVFGWEPQEPSAEFGGYFMFTRAGVPVAGGMGAMPDRPAENVWKIYLTTDDAARTVRDAAAAGAEIVSPTMPVADLGVQALLNDPTGAHLGVWQPGTFQGFAVLGEHGAPTWFELRTRNHDAAVAFYRRVFGWDTGALPGEHRIAYTTMRNPDGEGPLAGIMDASGFLPAGVPAHWSIYWGVDDVDAAIAKVKALGGSVVGGVEHTPFGRLATVTDPAGAEFRLRAPAP